MVAKDDWRLVFAVRVTGRVFRWKAYYQWSEEWDHDHCAACWGKFRTEEGYLNVGYASVGTNGDRDDLDWVCQKCFDELKGPMNWKLAE